MSPLTEASHNGYLEVVQALLEAKADVNVKDIYSWTALSLAPHNGHLKVVRALLKAEADVNVKDFDGWTALMFASQNGHLGVVQALLEAKADVNAKDDNGCTVLMWASRNGHLEVVQVLLKAKADVNVKNNDGWTLLSLASESGHLEVVQALLEAGADIIVPESWGWTGLHQASHRGHTEVVRELLAQRGADPSIVVVRHNDEPVIGYDALKIATLEGHTAVVELLKDWMLSHPASNPAAPATKPTDIVDLLTSSLAGASVTSTLPSTDDPSASKKSTADSKELKEHGKLWRVREKVSKLAQRSGRA